jgi:hypothetical protein
MRGSRKKNATDYCHLFKSIRIKILYYHNPTAFPKERFHVRGGDELFSAAFIERVRLAGYPVAQLCVSTLLATKVTLITDGI